MRLKFFLWLTLFVGVTILVFAVASFSYLKETIESNFELHLLHSADNILIAVAKNPILFKKNPSRFLYSLTRNEFTSSRSLVEFVDKNGNSLARTPGLKEKHIPFWRGETGIMRDVELKDGTRLKIYQEKIFIGGKDLGYLVIATPTSHLYQIFDQLLFALIIGSICVFAFVIVGISAIINMGIIADQKKFLSFVAHELRTSLSVILGNTEVALRSSGLTDKVIDSLFAIKEESACLIGLINNLLQMFRYQLGALPLRKTRFNLGELVAETAMVIKKKYSLKRFTIKLPEEAEIFGDVEQIGILVKNLLENAAIHTKEDGKIWVELISDQKCFILKVRDDGEGIKKEMQKKIFDLFYQDKESKGRFGVGLAIAKWVAEIHGGRIFVESEPGQGSTFIVNLPKT